MSEPEDFLSRWSRRKRDVAEETARQNCPPLASPSPPEQGTAATSDQEQIRPAETPETAPAGDAASIFDPKNLPPIESITAASDVHPFLAPGVPQALVRAALRRAWVTDPKIRDFVGLADYDWDYHALDTPGGFAPLKMTDALRKVVAQIVGAGTDAEPAAFDPTPGREPENSTNFHKTKPDGSVSSVGNGRVTDTIDQDIPAESAENVPDPSASPQMDDSVRAPQAQTTCWDYTAPLSPRAHGRALPK